MSAFLNIAFSINIQMAATTEYRIFLLSSQCSKHPPASIQVYNRVFIYCSLLLITMKAVLEISHRGQLFLVIAIPMLPMEEVMKVNLSRLTTSHHGEI